MKKNDPIRVLVIDDSAFNRRTLTKILESSPGIKVVATAYDGEDGLVKALELSPDLITLDLEMPRMDGFTLLRIMMKKRPTPVIVVSSRKGDVSVFKAMELGAVDFIRKPTHHLSPELFNIRDELIAKVHHFVKIGSERLVEMSRGPRIVGEASEILLKEPPAKAPAPEKAPPIYDYLAVAIGASTGGPSAIQNLLSAVNPDLPQAYLVSLHMPAGFTEAFADRLNNGSRLTIREARDGELIKPGVVYITPGGYNMIVERHGTKAGIRLEVGGPEDRYTPNIDKMFGSASEVFGDRCLGVILTGMGDDGVEGIDKIRQSGGKTIAESEKTAVIYGMPKEAITRGVIDMALPLYLIPDEVSGWPELKKLK